MYAGKMYNDIPLLPEEIYGVLQNLQTFSITNKERTELKICETVEMETLLSAGNIDKCQLDCMILAQKSKATIMYILKGKRGRASYPMCFWNWKILCMIK